MTMTDYSDMLERLEAEADSNERYGYLSRANFQIECADAIRSLLAAHEATKAELQALREQMASFAQGAQRALDNHAQALTRKDA